MEAAMGRVVLSTMVGSAVVALAGAAGGQTSLLGAGETNWFYACGGGQTMNIAVRHVDRTTTQFSLQEGQSLRGLVRLGDMVAWRCGGPVPAAARYIYVVTVPSEE